MQVVFIIVLNHVIACGWFLTGKFAVDTGGSYKNHLSMGGFPCRV
jgi:hypothetical protein